MNKKLRIVPTIITSRESLEAHVADIVRLKLEAAERTAAMEKEIAAVQKRHQAGLLELDRQLAVKEAGVFVFCQQRRSELFPDKKSLDTLLATVGFELTPFSVEKRNTKDTWGEIALRLQTLDWGTDFVRERDPEVDKAALLSKRAALTEAQLAAAGLRFEQDENFYIRPKSQVAEQTVREARSEERRVGKECRSRWSPYH